MAVNASAKRALLVSSIRVMASIVCAIESIRSLRCVVRKAWRVSSSSNCSMAIMFTGPRRSIFALRRDDGFFGAHRTGTRHSGFGIRERRARTCNPGAAASASVATDSSTSDRDRRRRSPRRRASSRLVAPSPRRRRAPHRATSARCRRTSGRGAAGRPLPARTRLRARRRRFERSRAPVEPRESATSCASTRNRSAPETSSAIRNCLTQPVEHQHVLVERPLRLADRLQELLTPHESPLTLDGPDAASALPAPVRYPADARRRPRAPRRARVDRHAQRPPRLPAD